MSSACVCHVDGEYCFFCEMYLPLESENKQLKRSLSGLIEAIDRRDLAQTRLSSGTDYVILLARQTLKESLSNEQIRADVRTDQEVFYNVAAQQEVVEQLDKQLAEIKERVTELMVATRNNSWSLTDNLINDSFKLLSEVNRLHRALEDTQKALQWGDPENAIGRALAIIHEALEPALNLPGRWTNESA